MPGCIFCPLYYILFWQFSHKLCIDENHDLISSGVSWFKALWKCCLLCKFVLILCSIWPGTKEAPLGQEVLVCRSENATPHLGVHGTHTFGDAWHALRDLWHTHMAYGYMAHLGDPGQNLRDPWYTLGDPSHTLGNLSHTLGDSQIIL